MFGIFYFPLDKEGYSKYAIDELQSIFKNIEQKTSDKFSFIMLPTDIGHRFIQDKDFYIKLLKDYIKSLEEQPND